jgi:hypothetical protein
MAQAMTANYGRHTFCDANHYEIMDNKTYRKIFRFGRLQHRGHLLMGSGHSIAVQNFDENLSILLMLGAYSLMIKAGFSIDIVVIGFGLFIAFSMGIIHRIHGHDQDLNP